jgi:toxin CptA
MQLKYSFHSSVYLAIILIVAHGVALAALTPLDLPLWAKNSLAFFIVFSLGYHLRLDAWLTAPLANVALLLEGDQIVMTMRNEKTWSGHILSDSLVTPYLTILNVLPLGARFTSRIIILPDTLDAESFRQLRVWLKWSTIN